MNTYTQKFDLNKESELRNFLSARGAEFEDFQYSKFKAKLKGATAIFYNSGKFLIQGADVSEIVQELEISMGIYQQRSLSLPPGALVGAPYEASGAAYSTYIGTDESGKGDYFGPLVIAGVLITDANREKFIKLGVKDSKKLNDTIIKKYAAEIKNNSIFSLVTIGPEKYNELYDKFKNLNKLLAWGHARVIENILEKQPCEYALSDKFGDESLIKNALMKSGRQIKLEQRHKAESDIAVAAASVVARAEFVIRMDELQKRYSMDLSKGASDTVIKQAKAFAAQHGKSELKKIAKLHFKTTQVV